MTRRRNGFTLVEALACVALMSAIVYMLGAVTAQWLPNWRHGFERAQRVETLDLGLQRIGADIAAALYVPPSNGANLPMFEGEATSLILVRRAIGPGAAPHLEAIRLSETVDNRGFAMVRERAPFAPLIAGVAIDKQLQFADAVPLVRAPFRVSFSYSGQDRVWLDQWRGKNVMPGAVRINIRDAVTDRLLSYSIATPVHISASADCARQKLAFACANGQPTAPAADAPAAAASPAAGAPTADGTLQ